MSLAAGIIASMLALPASAAPVNIACANAESMAFPSTVSASTTDVPDSRLSSRCGKDDRYALWYVFTAPADGRYLFATQDAGKGALADTTIAIYGACDVAADTCTDDGPDTLLASASADMVSGQEVWVRVAGWGLTRGAFQLVVNSPQALARPANDECAGAEALALGVPLPGTNINATGTDLSSCGVGDDDDIWYTFVAPEDGDYEFFVSQNMISDNIVSVATSCGAGELACGLGSTGTHLAAAQSVWIRVGIPHDASDSFNMNVGPAHRLVPPNDSFTHATPVTAPSSVAGTTIGATQDGIYFGPTCGSFVNAAVWYAFTAPADGTYVIDTDGSEMTDTIVAVFAGCDSNNGALPAFVNCDDDSGDGLHSRLDGMLLEGQSLCIAVAGKYLSDGGNFLLNIALEPPPPANDHCEGALTLPPGGTVHGDNYSSRPEDEPNDCPGSNYALWYQFTAPTSGDYKFTSKSQETSPDIAVYDACGGNLLGCDDTPGPEVSLPLTQGQSVFARIGTIGLLRSPLVLSVGVPGTVDDGGAGLDGGVDGAVAATDGGVTAPIPGGCSCDIGRTDTGAVSLFVCVLSVLAIRLGRRRLA